MNKDQLKTFGEMACILDQCGENTITDAEELERICQLAEDNKIEAWFTLMEEDPDQWETAEKAFEDLFGYDLADINRMADEFGFSRVVAPGMCDPTDIPNDYAELLEALREADGFMNGVNMNKGKFYKALLANDLIGRSGPNGVHQYGKDGLDDLTDEQVLEKVTGKTIPEIMLAWQESFDRKRIADMFETAKQFGYKVEKV